MKRLFFLFSVLSSCLCADVYSGRHEQFIQMVSTIATILDIGEKQCEDLGYQNYKILNCTGMLDLEDSGNVSFMFHFPRDQPEDGVIVKVKDGLFRMELLLFEPVN